MKFGSLREAMEDFLSEAGVGKVEELSEAVLDGHSISNLGDVSFLKGCEALGYVSLNKCDIAELPVFPAGLNIERLELSDNKIRKGIENLSNLAQLEELHLGGNPIESLKELQPLSKLSNLRILDLTDCPVVSSEADIHKKMFSMISSLEAFNGKDQSGESVCFEDVSDDIDDYSDEDSEDDDEDDEDDEDDDDDDDDEDDDEEDDEDGDDEKPSKNPRHE